MSRRLNQEREKELQPQRMEYAIEQIKALNLTILVTDDSKIKFEFKGYTVTFFPYSGWHTGKSIKDGRGIEKLLKQLQDA